MFEVTKCEVTWMGQIKAVIEVFIKVIFTLFSGTPRSKTNSFFFYFSLFNGLKFSPDVPKLSCVRSGLHFPRDESFHIGRREALSSGYERGA